MHSGCWPDCHQALGPTDELLTLGSSRVSRCSNATCFGDCLWSPHVWPEEFTKQEHLERDIIDTLPLVPSFSLQECGSWSRDHWKGSKGAKYLCKEGDLILSPQAGAAPPTYGSTPAPCVYIPCRVQPSPGQTLAGLGVLRFS